MQNYTLLSLFLSLTFLGISPLSAQKAVRLYLDNGWILQGDTLHNKDKQSLRLHTSDQQIFRFSFQEIDSIKRAEYALDQKGFRNLFQLGFLMHNPEPSPGVDPSLIGNFFSLSLQYTASYQLGKGLAIGAGSGINLFNRGYIMPIYLDMRKDLGRGKIRPQFYIQGGSSIPLYGREEVQDFWGNTLFEEFQASGGLLLETGFALKFLSQAPYSWSIGLGWRLQEITEEYKQWEIRYKDEYSFQRISFQLGFLF